MGVKGLKLGEGVGSGTCGVSPSSALTLRRPSEGEVSPQSEGLLSVAQTPK